MKREIRSDNRSQCAYCHNYEWCIDELKYFKHVYSIDLRNSTAIEGCHLKYLKKVRIIDLRVCHQIIEADIKKLKARGVRDIKWDVHCGLRIVLPNDLNWLQGITAGGPTDFT